MGDVCWFPYFANSSVAYTLPSIDISYRVFSLKSGENILENHWTPRSRSWRVMVDIRCLLAVDCGAYSVEVKAATIFYNRVAYGVFSGRPIVVGKIAE